MSLELTGVHGLLKRHKLFTHKHIKTEAKFIPLLLCGTIFCFSDGAYRSASAIPPAQISTSLRGHRSLPLSAPPNNQPENIRSASFSAA